MPSHLYLLHSFDHLPFYPNLNTQLPTRVYTFTSFNALNLVFHLNTCAPRHEINLPKISQWPRAKKYQNCKIHHRYTLFPAFFSKPPWLHPFLNQKYPLFKAGIPKHNHFKLCTYIICQLTHQYYPNTSVSS